MKFIFLIAVHFLISSYSLAYAVDINEKCKKSSINIKDGTVACYELDNYNKNYKLSIEYNDWYGEWRLKNNLDADVVSVNLFKRNNVIYRETLSENKKGNCCDSEYDVYNYINGANNHILSDMKKEGLDPKSFNPIYYGAIEQIMEKFTNHKQNTPYSPDEVVKFLTPLLDPEIVQLNKIVTKRNSLLPKEYVNYVLKKKNDDKCIPITSYDNSTYYNKNIRACYMKFTQDNILLESLALIDELYIKQDKKVRFIADTIKQQQNKMAEEKETQNIDKAKNKILAELRIDKDKEANSHKNNNFAQQGKNLKRDNNDSLNSTQPKKTVSKLNN